MNKTINSLSKDNVVSIRCSYVLWLIFTPVAISLLTTSMMNPNGSVYQYLPFLIGAINVPVLKYFWRMHALEGATMKCIGLAQINAFVRPPLGYEFSSKFTWPHGLAVFSIYSVIETTIWSLIYSNISIVEITVMSAIFLMSLTVALMTFKIEIESRHGV